MIIKFASQNDIIHINKKYKNMTIKKINMKGVWYATE